MTNRICKLLMLTGLILLYAGNTTKDFTKLNKYNNPEQKL